MTTTISCENCGDNFDIEPPRMTKVGDLDAMILGTGQNIAWVESEHLERGLHAVCPNCSVLFDDTLEIE